MMKQHLQAVSVFIFETIVLEINFET